MIRFDEYDVPLINSAKCSLNSAHAEIVMVSSLTGQLIDCLVPRKSSRTSVSVSSEQRNGFKEISYADIDSSSRIATTRVEEIVAIRTNTQRNNINSNISQQPRQSFFKNSVYEDPNIPLSFFLHPSMNRVDNDEAHLTDYQRSLLDTPQPKTNVEKPNSNAARRLSSATGSTLSVKKDKHGKIIDQPITFQSKIKSSGYGQIPQDSFERKRFFQQQEKLKKQNAEKRVSQLQRSLSAPRSGRKTEAGMDESNKKPSCAPSGAHIRQYPMECGPVLQHMQICDITPIPALSVGTSCPVHHVAYTTDGGMLGVASGDAAVVTMRLPTHNYPAEGSSIHMLLL